MHRKKQTMLKAVRFDLDEHAKLIEFVENYRDSKNKPNHSEAIRLLMTKRLESLNQKQESQQPNFDMESIKTEIFNQIMNQISSMGLQPPKQEKIFEPPKQEDFGVKPQTSTPRPPTPAPKVNVNPLLANILGNSER